MSSRTSQKAQARAARVAAEEAATRSDLQRRRLRMLAGAALVASLVVLVAVIASRSGTTEQVSDAERVTMFDGIPQSGEWLGRPDAPVVVEEYADLQCPFCADFATRDLPALVADYVRPGQVRMRLRLLTFLGPDSVEGGRVAAAAGLQDKQWDFAESFYARQGEENSGYVDDAFLRSIGSGVPGLDVDRALAERDDARARRQLTDARTAAQEAQIASTPTFRVGRRGGELRTVSGEELPAAIAAALRQR